MCIFWLLKVWMCAIGRVPLKVVNSRNRGHMTNRLLTCLACAEQIACFGAPYSLGVASSSMQIALAAHGGP